VGILVGGGIKSDFKNFEKNLGPRCLRYYSLYCYMESRSLYRGYPLRIYFGNCGTTAIHYQPIGWQLAGW